MLICKKCGAKLADQSKKCYSCGTIVTPETVTYYDPFAEEAKKNEASSMESASSFGPTGNTEAQGPRAAQETQKTQGAQGINLWEQLYGKDAENKKQPTADYDWQDENWQGDAFSNLSDEEKQVLNAPTDEQLLIGPGALGYSEKFKRMREKNSVFGWNWGAFLLGPLWFGYRKMYGMAVFTLIIGFFTNFLSTGLGVAVTIVIDVLMGLFGDRIYLEHIAGLTRKAGRLNTGDKTAYIRRHGGVALWFLFIMLLVWQFVSMILVRS